MTRRPPAAVVALSLVPLLALAACGSDETTTTTAAPPKPPPKETRDPLPERPREWDRFINERGGYSLLVPQGWEAKADGPRTLIRSFDRLVALSIVPDRSSGALATQIADYAANTAEGLGGFEDGFRTRGTRRFEHRYDAVEVYGAGRSRDGVDQEASVIVLRRDDVATITAVLAANAKRDARESVRIARRVVGTIRTRAPRAHGEGGDGGDGGGRG